jgi:hypothetical protein
VDSAGILSVVWNYARPVFASDVSVLLLQVGGLRSSAPASLDSDYRLRRIRSGALTRDLVILSNCACEDAEYNGIHRSMEVGMRV